MSWALLRLDLKFYKAIQTKLNQIRTVAFHSCDRFFGELFAFYTNSSNKRMRKKKKKEKKHQTWIYLYSCCLKCVCVCIYKHNYEPAHDYYCRINGAIYFIMIFCIRRFVAVNGSVAWVLGALKYFCVVLSCLVLCCIQIWFYVHALCLKCLHE